MPTAGALIDQVIAQLHGWGATRDRFSYLSANIGPTDSTFNVDATAGPAIGVSPGPVEIDSEQIYVISVDQGSGTCTVGGGNAGRGFSDTTPASHLDGAKVVSNPKFPRVWVLQQLNDIIGGLYPQLFKVDTFVTTVTYPSNTYSLPVQPPLRVLDVQWQNPLGNWERCYSYELDPYDGTLRLGGGPMLGRPLRIAYSSEPSPFTQESDDFVGVTGLPISCADVLTLGVVAKQAPGLDLARAQISPVDPARPVPAGAAVAAAKYIMAMYQDRLKNEGASLRKQYRTFIVRTAQ